MTANIYSNNLLIGHSDLKVGDENMGCVFGEFIPTDYYYKYIQQSVWEFGSTNKPDYNKWHALNFNVQLENGYFLCPLGGYTFEDVKEYPNESKRIDIAGLHRHVIEDFFLENPARPFVEEPWETILIDQKIVFEKELKREIKKNSNLFFGLIKSGGHVLDGYECYALCKSGQADDILFTVHKKDDSKNHFALVHLTFSGTIEEDPKWPRTQFFESFDEFKHDRMYPDKVDWES